MSFANCVFMRITIIPIWLKNFVSKSLSQIYRKKPRELPLGTAQKCVVPYLMAATLWTSRACPRTATGYWFDVGWRLSWCWCKCRRPWVPGMLSTLLKSKIDQRWADKLQANEKTNKSAIWLNDNQFVGRLPTYKKQTETIQQANNKQTYKRVNEPASRCTSDQSIQPSLDGFRR